MAEDREEGRKKRYSHARSQKARGDEPERKDNAKEEKGEKEAPDTGHLNAGEMVGRHAAERETLRTAHEGERRGEHMAQRAEHRTMNVRHEKEHDGVTEHPAVVALHRKQEHEKHAMRSDHEKRHKDMADRQHAERHSMNMKHEAEMLGAAGGGAGEAEAAAAPAAGAAPAQAEAA